MFRSQGVASTSGGAKPIVAALLTGALVLGAPALAVAVGPASVAGAATSSSPASTVTLTLPTALHHRYRHGAVPRKTRDVRGVAALQAGQAQSAAPATSASRKLTYGGGLTVGGLTAAGVTTGQPKIYLVFMGSQWGAQGTNGSGQATFSGDPASFAPVLQTFYGGLGTAGETWSGVMTQYCDGVAVGATTCTQGSAMIPHPTGGVLAGVWYDNSSTATSLEAGSSTSAGPTGGDLAAEAELAATHFSNTDQASNRNTQYVIVSPTGANPDGWANQVNGYCAYHDDTHDPSLNGVGPAAGPIASFTNLPYVPDAGTSCGSGSVNGAAGALDGATEAASHEYAETLTDQFPETYPYPGWVNSAAKENGDLCAYVPATAPGPAFNLTLATGTVAVQGSWSNRGNNGKGACSDGEADYVFSPHITSFGPAKGAAGTNVTITGTNLSGATSVTFAGTTATVVADSVTSITVTVPTGASDGAVTVVTPLGTATSATSFHLTPTITSFSPSTAAIGASVTITGSGLGAAKKVTIAGKKSTITSDSPTQIVATVGARTVSGSIVVTTKYGIALGSAPLAIG